MDEKQIIKAAAKQADKLLNFNKMGIGIAGVVIELVDGKLSELAIAYVYSAVPNEDKPDFLEFLDHFAKEEYELMTEEVIEEIAEKVDTPLEDEEEEKILTAIFSAILSKIKKKK